jgi:acetyl esterase
MAPTEAFAEPNAEMRAAMAVDAKQRADHPVPADLVEDRALRAKLAPFWIEGAPQPHQVRDEAIQGDCGPIRIRVYRPTAATGAPIILLIHGGGWAFGSIEETEPLARHLAAATGAVVVSTSYRLAPEHPYPAGLQDCEQTLRWIGIHAASLGGDATRLAVAGSSAGGNLAAAMSLRAPKGAIKAQALFYGVLGNSFETPSYLHYGPGQFGLSRQRMIDFFDWYAPAGTDRDDPGITPLQGDISKMPPTWLCAAECDVLHDDTVQLYERLRVARPGDQYVLAKGLTHGFINRVQHLPPARAIIASAAAFLKAKL